MKKPNYKKRYKRRMFLLSVVLVFLLALGAFLIVWFFGASYPAFYGAAKEEVEIPGLDDGISPQGLCPLPENNGGYRFAMSGYMGKGAPSRVYLIGEDSKYVTLKEHDGTPLKAHFGGITSSDNFLIVCNDKEIVRVHLDEVLKAENGGSVEIFDSFETGLQNAFCYYENGTFYAGEFYRAGNYETAESHHLTVNGETNYALVYLFDWNANDTAPCGGLKAVISVRGLVQGIAVYDGGITLSTSYGLADSVLYTYRNILSEETADTFTVEGEEVPLYRLDSSNQLSAFTLPCMSEEIFEQDGRLYILFESMSNQYKYFVREQINKIYSLPVQDLLS